MGRFGICLSKAGDTRGMKYSLALQRTKAVEEKTPASLLSSVLELRENVVESEA